jgi:DNA polymerase
MQQSKYELLKQIRDELLNLKESPLYEYRKSNHYFPVIGEGSHDAVIMFVGEAPGENEAKTGRPFCGAAGKVLDEMLLSVGINRKEVYVTNIVKDRPPNNRDPNPKEIELYSPFLVRQIDILKPRVIATLGRFSMTFVLTLFKAPEQTDTITRLHGKKLKVKASYGDILIIPQYHPAVCLYNPSTKATMKKDFEVFKAVL